jgi:DNA polymerase V
MGIVSQLCPEVEVYSIDEAFLGLTGVQESRADAYGRRLREIVLRETGIPVSVGVAATKTLAKAANRMAKKTPCLGGVLAIARPDDTRPVLERLSVEDVWGVGQRYAERLRRRGILTALHLSQADEVRVKKDFGIGGLRTVWELRGKVCHHLQAKRPPAKTISEAKGFGQPVQELEDLLEAIAAYADRAAQRLRGEGLVARRVSAFVSTGRFGTGPRYGKSGEVTFSFPTAFGPEIIVAAQAVISELYRPGCDYKKVGITLSDLTSADSLQLPLFPDEKLVKQQKLMAAVDRINGLMGRNTLRVAGSGVPGRQVWRMHQQWRSGFVLPDNSGGKPSGSEKRGVFRSHAY